MADIERDDKDQAESDAQSWRRFVTIFMAVFAGGLASIYLFVLLIDPYDVVAFSLPIERRLVSVSQRYMYPQVVRSGRFDAIIVGTSTSRLIDPEILNPDFGARFANLAMDSMTAWEQQQVVSLFLRHAKAPKALVVGLDGVWCDRNADSNRITPRGFPDWLYDNNRWNDFLYLLNSATLEIAGRMAGYQLGLYRERVRYDGFEVFVPPEEQYDLERARSHIWGEGPRNRPAQNSPVILTQSERQKLNFPALAWLDAILVAVPPSAEKILVFMPVHIAAQSVPGSQAAAVEDECKAQIAAIARKRGAVLADWRIASPITVEDSNYWDNLHYRLPIANRIARDLAGPVRAGRASVDKTYQLLVGK
jgi:hypothetical protein